MQIDAGERPQRLMTDAQYVSVYNGVTMAVGLGRGRGSRGPRLQNLGQGHTYRLQKGHHHWIPHIAMERFHGHHRAVKQSAAHATFLL